VGAQAGSRLFSLSNMLPTVSCAKSTPGGLAGPQQGDVAVVGLQLVLQQRRVIGVEYGVEPADRLR